MTAPSPTTKPQVEYHQVTAEIAGQRLDNYLLARLKGVPKSWVYRVIRRGEVRINKGRAKPSQHIQTGDQIRIPPVRTRPETSIQPNQVLQQRIQDAILYEDDQFLVLNKPSGIAVHGGSGISQGVIEILRSLRPPPAYLELVHRLDRETSGCLMIAKKRSVLRQIQQLQQQHHISKRYMAMVHGTWPEQKVRVEAPLCKNTLQNGERIVKVDPNGKIAKTQFRVQQHIGDNQLVEARIETGRTHQIRVHAAHLGTPILGDEKYGNTQHNRAMRQQGLKRLFLHAWQLRFRWPNEQGQHHFTAPLPAELVEVVDRLGKLEPNMSPNTDQQK